MTLPLDSSTLRAAGLAVLILVALSAAQSVQASSDSAGLFPRAYISTVVTKDGAPHSLFEGTRIKVDFEHRDRYDVVRWAADCNTFGARVRITDERLITGQIAGTAVGCPDSRLHQDRWIVRFFGSDPRWRINRAGTLKLTVGGRVIELRRRATSG